MQRQSKTILGFVAATLAPQLVIYVTSIEHGSFGQMRDVAWYTLLASCGMTVLCLLPAYFMLLRRGRSRFGDYLWTSIKAAVLMGMLTGLVVEMVRWHLHFGAAPSPSIPPIFGFLAALVIFPMSALFWLIARPDQAPPRGS